MSHPASSKQPPPEEDAREWLLFDIDDEDPTTANFLKPATSSPLLPTRQTYPTYRDEEDEIFDEADRPLISRGGLLTELEAPYVAEAERLERFDSGSGERRFDIIKLPHIGGGLVNSVVNMSNSIIGAGIIGLPYAFNRAGLVLGMVLLFVLTGVVDWTIRLIVVNAKLSGSSSYQDTVAACFGHGGLIAVSLAQFCFAAGGMVSFCVIIGDTIPHVLAAVFPGLRTSTLFSFLINRQVVIILCTALVSYPLSLYRDITKLAKASALALVSMVIIVYTVVSEGPNVPEEYRGTKVRLIPSGFGIFQAIGVISFAFVCHHNSLLIYGALKKPTMDRFSTVTHFSTGLSLVACLIMALAGDLVFKDKTMGNILNNFPSDIGIVNLARFCFGFNCFTTLPLELFVCREVITNYYWPSEPFHQRRHFILTTALVFSAMFISLITSDLGIVLEITGSTSAVAIAFLLPPLCYMHLTGAGEWRSWGREKKWWGPALCTGFAAALMVISIVQVVVEIITGKEL